MKKILLVTFSDNADHQDAIFGLFEELLKIENTYLLSLTNPKVPLNITEKVMLINAPRRPGITKGTFNFRLLFNMVRKIKKMDFDLIYFESLHVWNLPFMIFKSKKTKTYQVIHDVIPHQGDKGISMVKLMNKVTVILADYIVLRNKKYINVFKEKYKIHDSKIIFLNLWRRYPLYTPPTLKKNILFFGRLNVYKGIDNLLEIVKLCPNVKFYIVGKADKNTQKYINELSKCDNVCLKIGYVSDLEMKYYFTNSDWIILPYSSATQSGVIIDAYKYSRPVIAYNVGAISEQIDDGKTGFLVDSGNSLEFANIINYVISMDNEEYDFFSKNAYEFGVYKYSTKTIINDFRGKIVDV